MNEKNLLSKEKSPYLLQHKDNPVNWFPWGDDAFVEARAQNKPIFLSIGYSTCYWCHVMEKESFEQADVASVLNESFISIKVDREERPDVDRVYMEAVQAVSGHGGWPMSVFLMPDGKPFFGGTYFQKPQFIQILNTITDKWKTEFERIAESSEQLTAALAEIGESAEDVELDNGTLKLAIGQMKANFDSINGGFGAAPKFPPSMRLQLLLRLARRTGDEDALEMVVQTLRKMARGGIYDHLGGGFSRYSTDAEWLVPHFEKMLYDNALLATTYLEAFTYTKDKEFLNIALETLDYVVTDLVDESGGIHSAEDAGEVGKEGEYYVWGHDELKALLSSEEVAFLEKHFSVSKAGNFEHQTNVLSMQSGTLWSIREEPEFKQIRRKLLSARDIRERPHRDDKILTAWNGLMITALARGYQVSDEKRYLDAAVNAAKCIEKNLWKENLLLRRFRDGESKFSGYLDDYAFFIQALIDLYQTTFEPDWLELAIDVQRAQDEILWDSDAGGYFFSDPKDKQIFVHKKEYADGAKPSGNSISALNLLKLYHLTLDKSYKLKAEKLFSTSSANVSRYPAAFASLLQALDFYLDRSKEVAIVAEANSAELVAFISELGTNFTPNIVLAVKDTASKEGEAFPSLLKNKNNIDEKTTFYVCEEGTCQLPTNEPKEALLKVFEVEEIK